MNDHLANKLINAILGLTTELKRYNDHHCVAITGSPVRVRADPELFTADYDPASRAPRLPPQVKSPPPPRPALCPPRGRNHPPRPDRPPLRGDPLRSPHET